MSVSKFKLTTGILVCMVSILILDFNITRDLVSITRSWKEEIGGCNNRNNCKITNGEEDDINFCSNEQENRTWFQTGHGMLLQNKTIYYCNVPKCGSTFMNLFLKKLFNHKEESSYFMVPIKKNVNVSNVYSFMFVREPYGRILSAYENKLFNPNPFFELLGTDIVREVRQNPSELSLKLGHDVTFTELIQYIVKFYIQGRTLNPHITAIHTLCNPCKQKYDFIGKLETMTTDLAMLVNEWHSRGLLNKDEAPTLESDTQISGLFGIIGHMFNFYEMNKGLLSKYKLFQRTWSNFKLRGYIHNNYKLPYNETSVKDVSRYDYTKVLVAAIDASKNNISQLKAQKKEALLQSYRNVPLELLEKLSQYLKSDCEIFGYENRPSWIFNRSSIPLSGNNYFEWI